MLRMWIMCLINLSIPLLAYMAWQVLLRVQKSQRSKKGLPPVIDITPVPHWPYWRLLFVGLVCLAAGLVYLRWEELPQSPSVWHSANPATNVEF